jgi:hypothetical protein
LDQLLQGRPGLCKVFSFNNCLVFFKGAFPNPNRLPIDHYHRAEYAVARNNPLVVFKRDCRISVLVADDEFVIGGEQVGLIFKFDICSSKPKYFRINGRSG